MGIVPNSTPKIVRTELHDAIIRRYPDYEYLPFQIIGIRGYYMNSMGKPGVNDRAIYDDAIILLTDTELHTFNANCDPSKYQKGIAKLKAGIWDCYAFDIHRGASAQYPAICQRGGKVTVIRDGRGEDKGMFGINIHKGSYHHTSSLGCQTIYPTQWDRFYATALRLAQKAYTMEKYKAKKDYRYILIEF